MIVHLSMSLKIFAAIIEIDLEKSALYDEITVPFRLCSLDRVNE